MTPTRSTRRRVLQGIGAAGVIGVLGATTTAADEHEADEEDDENDETSEDDEMENDEMEAEEFAALRCGHLSPDTPDIDVYAGKTADLNPTVAELSYPAFGPGPMDGYLQLPPGNYNLEIAPAGTTDIAIDVEDIELEAGYRYSALAIGQSVLEDDEETETEDDEETETGLQPLVIADAASGEDATPPAEEAEISFVHASPDAGPVEITVDGETLLEDVAFGDASDYFAVEPGDYDIDVVVDEEDSLAVTRTLRAGTRITAYVVGVVGDGIEDEDETEDVEDEEEDEVENDNDEMDDEEDEDEMEEELPGLHVVTTLDGTNPFADVVVTR